MRYSIEICGFDYHPAVIINGRYAYFGYTRRSFNQAWEECWILATPIADQNYPKYAGSCQLGEPPRIESNYRTVENV